MLQERKSGASVFIALMALAALVCFALALTHWQSSDPVKFACYLGAALLASSLKVSLPSIEGTLSVNFLFTLLGNSGTEYARDPADRAGQHPGSVLLEARTSPQVYSARLQSVAGDGFQRSRIWPRTNWSQLTFFMVPDPSLCWSRR